MLEIKVFFYLKNLKKQYINSYNYIFIKFQQNKRFFTYINNIFFLINFV